MTDEVWLETPDGELEEKPQLSLVVPAMNEEVTIGEFIDWCNEGLARSGLKGEILIIDSSTDRTPAIALAKGARVLHSPKRGLGRAYIDAIPFIRGDFIIMGDADCTYDFRELAPFAAKFREGFEFIMGSRMIGTIEPGAMPDLHRYFGNPLTTWILNFVYGTKFSDIHCGMRGITKSGLKQIGLTSQGWEYASEMIVKASQFGLRISEVPINFYKDRAGRISHVKRSGWLTPWRAGWHTVKIILVYGFQHVAQPLSVAFMLFGLPILLCLSLGPVKILGLTFTLHTEIFASTLLLLGLVLYGISVLSACINDRKGSQLRQLSRRFHFTRAMAISAALFGVGFLVCASFLLQYISRGFTLADTPAWIGHLSVAGLTAMVVAALLASFAILLHALADRILGGGDRAE